MFVFKLPRLSVDIDINYIGALDRKKMLTERQKIEQALQAVFNRAGFYLRKSSNEHAGGKWTLRYESFTGFSGNLEIDINYMYRQPLWDIQYADSHFLGTHQVKNIPLLNIHELAAGKLAALFSRGQARDLFDCYNLLSLKGLNQEHLRIAFVIYGAMNRKDWRTITNEDIHFDLKELNRKLFPLLHTGILKKHKEPKLYANKLVNESKRLLSMVYPFTKPELQFLNTLLDKGEIDPTILTADKKLQKRILIQPLLEWKSVNVKKHKRIED